MLNDLYCSSNIVRVIKSRRIRWAGHVARMGGEVHIGFWWGYRTERDHLEDLGIDGKIILKCILKTEDEGMDWIAVAEDSER
jgi:hypothetical protein